MKQKKTHRYREKTCDCQVGGWWGSLELADGNYCGQTAKSYSIAQRTLFNIL